MEQNLYKIFSQFCAPTDGPQTCHTVGDDENNNNNNNTKKLMIIIITMIKK